MTGTWVPTRALGRAVLLCGALVLGAVFLGRVDLIVLAAPFAIGTAWSLRRRPTAAPAVAFEVAHDDVAEGSELALALELSHEDGGPLDLVVGRLTTSASRSESICATCSSRVRRVTRQSMRRRRSPGPNRRMPASSPPSPGRRDRCTPTSADERGIVSSARNGGTAGSTRTVSTGAATGALTNRPSPATP
jgi:hypothetical protein